MRLKPITPNDAKKIIEEANHVSSNPFAFAIAVENDEKKIIGVIGMYANGVYCQLGHLWTSGEPLAGSVLYGAAWRACKALGYSEVSL